MKAKPTRIALISEHASPLALAGGVDAGGQNIYVAQVARSLAAAGNRVDVLTRRDDPALPAAVDLRRGVRVLHLDAGPPAVVPKQALMPHMPAFADAAHRLFMRSAAYDVMHANFFTSGWVGLALRQRFNVPLVTTFHGLDLVRRQHPADEQPPFPAERAEIERALIAGSDRVIAVCPQDESDLMRLYGAAPERITNIPCGVDPDAFRPGDRLQARQRLGLPAGEFILLHVGRLVERKGIANAVRALALLPPELPARLVVVGGGSPTADEAVTPEVGRLRTLAHSLGVADRLHFAGRCERAALRDWYLAADVLVTTPWYEPFGMTPLEAMACGTPVLGSAVGGVQYTVVDGVTGHLVPPHDPGALADKLLQLQRNPALAAAMGRAGARRVRAQFTWDHVAQRLLRVYERVRQEQMAVGSARRPTLALLQPVPAQPSAGALR